jgi:hypothetical protein
MYNEFESVVAEAVNNGEKVEYVVTPIYSSAIPYPVEIRCVAKGNKGLNLDLVIKNQK